MPIRFEEDSKTFVLETKSLTYAFGVNPTGFLEHYYFGRKLDPHLAYRPLMVHDYQDPRFASDKQPPFSLDSLPQEYPPFGLGDYRVEAIKLIYEDGSRNNDFRYLSHEILAKKTPIPGMPSLRGKQELVVSLSDGKCLLKLHYGVYEEEDAISRWAEIENQSQQTIEIDDFASGCLDLHGSGFQAISLSGFWAGERHLTPHDLAQGILTIDSNTGTSSNRQNPFVAISSPTTSETSGLALGFSLIYSGDFSFRIEQTYFEQLRIVGGINPRDFRVYLHPQDHFASPELALTYSEEGYNKMSQSFHDLYRRHLMNPDFVKAPAPIVINNWEATYFRFTEEKLLSIIDEAHELGLDAFVLDDGWFGHRDDDHSSLGDWFVNSKKLPRGLAPLIERCQEYGMRFGIWIEPEMISEDSKLYQAHPDWAIASPKGILCRGRNQLILDLANPKVMENIKAQISLLLDENEISYVKWDCNRYVTEYYSPSSSKEEQGCFSHRQVLALYELASYLTARYPKVYFEGCAGGGGRFDPAMLSFFPSYWTSDDTDAHERELIQYGTSYAYPLLSMSAHVSAVPNHQTGRISPLSSREDVSSLATPGYELNLSSLTKEEKERTKLAVKKFRSLSSLIREGDLYRTDNPFASPYFGEVVVSKDKRKAYAVFGNCLTKAFPLSHYFRFLGLDPKKRYEIQETGDVYEGSVLLHLGLPIRFECDFQTKSFTLIAKEG